MQPTTATRLFTFDQFCEMVREDQKADLIDGVIHMASPESLEGNELVGWVLWVMTGFADERDLGRVYFERVAFRLARHQMPEPDIAFVHKDRQHLSQYGYFDGPPDLAMEFVSPESVERDYEKKRKQYQDAGVREYWIIDEIAEQVTLLGLQPAGEFAPTPPDDGGRFRSAVLPGFYLRPEWLWRTPRPKKGPILARMLGETS